MTEAVSFVFLAVVFGTMMLEAALSVRHERELRTQGAVEPPGDVFGVMRWAYPLCFVSIAIEGLAAGSSKSASLFLAGVVVFLIAKLLKWWAMATLGTRWTFRVLVLPDVPLIGAGPYRYLRHPNYLAVAGELAGAAIALGAPVSGVLGTVGFGLLMRRRIIIEERGLGIRGRGPTR